MIRKTICLLLVAVLTFAAVGCSGNKNKSNSTKETEKKTEDILSYLPDVYFNGYSFSVLARDGESYTREIFDDGSSTDRVNAKVFKRNALLSKKYGFDIALYTVNNPNEEALANELRRSISTHDFMYDLALCHTISSGGLAAEGSLYNWNSIPLLDYEKPWWSKSLLESLEVANSLYMATNAISLHSMEYAWGMVYSVQLAEDMNVEDNFYDLVDSGDWTIDKLISITKNISDDIDGEQGMGINDRYGMGINWEGGTIALMYGMGQKVIERDDEGYPELNFYGTKMQTIVEKEYELMYGSESCLVPKYRPFIYDAFRDNRILVSMIVLNELADMREMRTAYGILPLPKYDEIQTAYMTMVDGHANMMCIPSYIQDVQREGVILEALAALSHEMVVPEFYETTLMQKETRDDDSKRMLDLILNGRTYDFGYLYDVGGMSFIIYMLMDGQSTDFTSMYASREPSALTQIMNLTEKFEALNGN